MKDYEPRRFKTCDRVQASCKPFDKRQRFLKSVRIGCRLDELVEYRPARAKTPQLLAVFVILHWVGGNVIGETVKVFERGARETTYVFKEISCRPVVYLRA